MNSSTTFRTYRRIYWFQWCILFASFALFCIVDWYFDHSFIYHSLFRFVSILVVACLLAFLSATYLKRAFQQAVERATTTDPLTGLPNRIRINEQIAWRLANSSADTLCAVIHLDLDRFNTVNDSLGHHVGDQLLQTVSERIRSCVGKDDIVARINGDAFSILLSNIRNQEEVECVALSMLDAIAKPIETLGRELFFTASIGIALYPTHSDTVDLLLRHAEGAMYLAKEQGGDQFQFYVSQLASLAAERMELETSLRRAIEKNEFELYYQPKVDIKTNEIIGMEALLRWNHGKLGWISPAKFIPVAEASGLIVPIGDWVLRTACTQNKAWQNAGLPKLCVAVNLSARQFQRQNLSNVVSSILYETDLEPEWLELEVTESILMHNIDKTVGTLQELKDMGVRISIDDFGTGYSSLNYLKKFPIDTLKIDQSFVRDIASDPDDAAIVTAVISLAHTMKLKVIAEGVETLDQLEFLRHKNCDKMQGYYYSRPLATQDFAALLQLHTDLQTFDVT